MADTAQIPDATQTALGTDTGLTVTPASSPAPAASPDTLAAAHSAFGADLQHLLVGTESAEASAPPDGPTADAALSVQGDAAGPGQEQPFPPGQPGQAAEQGAPGQTASTDTDAGSAEPDPFETRLRELGLWETYRRREQSARDSGAARERQRLQRDQPALHPPQPAQVAQPAPASQAAQPAQPHRAALDSILALQEPDRVSLLNAIPDVQAALANAGNTVAQDFARTLGLDLSLVPPDAFQEALSGRPDKLRDAIIQHSAHIQDAIRTAHEAGTRATRSALRAANPLPLPGDPARTPRQHPQTYEEAQSLFAQALSTLSP